MPLLRVEAEKLSTTTLERGVIEEIIDNDAMFAMLPFMRIQGKGYIYDRELELAEGDFLDPNDTINESASTFQEVVAKLRILIGDVDVDNFLDETMSETNDQTAVQIAAKVKGMSRKFQRTLVQGDNSARNKEFDGIQRLVTADQTFYAGSGGNGGALTFENLDRLLRMIPLGADALVMRGGTTDAIAAMLRQLGGTNPEHVTISLGGDRKISVPSYRSVPIIINDFLSDKEVRGAAPTTCSIYAARFNEADGVHGIFGGPTAGVRVSSVGPVQNKDAERYRVKWYTGLALKSTKSLARLGGVTNI